MDIVLPDMESVTEGVVVEWRVAVGEAVAAEQTVVEVSTDKVDLEVPAPAAGTLEEIAVEAGETFQVGQPLGRIAVGADGGAPAGTAAPPSPPRPGRPRRAAGRPGAARRATSSGRASAPSRAAWRSAAESTRRRSGGPGPGGMVRKADVLAAAPGAAPAGNGGAPAAPGRAAGEEAVALRGPAAALAGYMDESLSIPTATSFRTLGVGALDAQRRAINADLKGAGREEKLSFTHLVAWALVRAAEALPVMGTGYAVVDGTPHKLVREAVNLGLAVDVERKDGSRSLLVPVVRDAGGARLPRLPRRLRRPGAPDPRGPGQARRAARRHHQPHQPRRPRDRGVGAAPHAGPGHHRRDRGDRLPGGARRGGLVGPGRRSGSRRS